MVAEIEKQAKIAFRVDSSLEMGSGHVMRCLTLADELKRRGYNVFFLCRDLLGSMQNVIRRRGYVVLLLNRPNNEYSLRENDPKHASWLGVSWEEDSAEVISILNGDLDYLVVDHYGIDYRWHEALRSVAKKIIVVDDLADRVLDCDILLNQTYAFDKKKYSSLIDSKCWVVMGSMYALVSPAFSQLRSEAIQKRIGKNSVSNILIFMGGMDADNATGKMLNALALVELNDNTFINVVLSRNAPHYESVSEQISNITFQVNLLSDVSNMEKLMLEADLAIGSGGTASWERCCLGVPTLLMVAAENQKNVVKSLSSFGAVVDLGELSDFDVHRLSDEIKLYLFDDIKRRKMSLLSMAACDGKGVFRVAQYIDSISSGKESVYLRPVKFNDAEVMYRWQSDNRVRKYARNPQLPTWDEHVAWLAKKLQDVSCLFNLVVFQNKAVGIVRLDENKNNSYEVSIVIDPVMQGNGLALAGLRLAKELVPNSVIVADVNPENKASQFLFNKLGYSKVNARTYVLH